MTWMVTRVLSRAVAARSGGFFAGASMDYQAFTNGSLTVMYETVRGALASDDAQEQRGEDPRFRVRATPAWKKHAADLEAEMLKRGMLFSVIEWHDGQEKLPFE
jgi:hypothetical protein